MANLVSIYKADLEHSLGNEIMQFAAIVNLYKEHYNGNITKELFFYKVIDEKAFKATFTNVEIALRMHLVLMVSNCRVNGVFPT